MSRSDVNKSNRLGTGGALTEELSQLMIAMWTGRFRAVAPASFKRRLNATKSAFNDNEQHDAQEFLAEILDAIHEDLNCRAAVDSSQREGAPATEEQDAAPSASSGENAMGVGAGGPAAPDKHSFAAIGPSLDDDTANKLSTEVEQSQSIVANFGCG